MTEYVRANPWHTRGPAATASDEDVMTKARKGGEAVAAAAAAAATAGFDANEIDLGGFSDDDEVGGSNPVRVDTTVDDPD